MGDSRYSVDLFHKVIFVAEQYGYALRSCYQCWPFQKFPKEDHPRMDEGRLIEVFRWEREFYEAFCNYEDLFPKYSREDFYWHWIWEGEEKREALFARLQDVKEQFFSLARAVIIAEDEAEAERKGIKAWKAAKTPPQAGQGKVKDKEISTYQWETKEGTQEVYCNGKSSGKLEPRLFKTYKILFEKRGQEVKITRIHRDRDKARENVRKLKESLLKGLRSKGLRIDRKELDEIIKPITNQKRKITAFVFTRNLS